MKRAPMTKIEHPLHLMIRYVDPDRVRCPVKDCEDEGLEENRITTPFIAGLGPLEVYLCSAHAAQLAAAFLELQPSITDFSSDVVQWDEPEATSPDIPYPSPARPGEAGALFAFMGWLTSRKEVSGPFSGHHEAGQGAHLVGEFIRMQGWQEPPDGWWHSIKPYTEEEKEALGRVHLENYRDSLEKNAQALIETHSQPHDYLTEITWTSDTPFAVPGTTGHLLFPEQNNIVRNHDDE
jgi:hypothetical protein